MVRKRVSAVVLGALAVALVGCGKDEHVDPYTTATLREATYGEVPSEGFQYKIVNPQIIDSLGSFVLVRQANLTEFLTGNDLVEQIKKLSDTSTLTFNVVKQFKPMVHFQCISVVSPSDSLMVSHDKPIAFPRIVDAASFVPPADFLETDITQFRYDDTEGLFALVHKKHSIRAKLTRMEEDSASVWILEGDMPCGSYFTRDQNLAARVPKLRVQTPRPGLEIVLRALERNDIDFSGGITFTEVELTRERHKNYICGTAEIAYVRFLDKVFLR
jgi:hypothetical protein